MLQELYVFANNPENELDSAAELVNIAELYDDFGHKDRACTVLGEAQAVAQKVQDSWFRLERLIEIADTYASVGSTDQSLTILRESILLLNEIEEYSRPYFMLRLADVYIFLNEDDEAGELLKSIPAVLQAEETVYEKARSLIETAEKYLAIWENTAAVELLVQAVRLAETITDNGEKTSIHIEIAEWLDEAGHLDEALQLAARAYSECRLLTEKKSVIFNLGNLCILYVCLKETGKAGQIMDDIIRIVRETAVKTSGLGAIGEELAAEGQPEMALRLAEIIKEPDVRGRLLTTLAAKSINSSN